MNLLKIENKITNDSDLQPSSSCRSSGAGNHKKQKVNLLLPIDIKTEQLSLIDLTIDTCFPSVQEHAQKGSPTKIQNKVSTSTEKNVTLKANICLGNYSKCELEPRKKHLKQTHLNFFGSAIRLPEGDNGMKCLTNKLAEPITLKKCKSSENDIKPDFIDLCERENVGPDFTEKKIPQLNDIRKASFINTNLKKNVSCEEKFQTSSANVYLCLDSSSEDKEMAYFKHSKVQMPKTVCRRRKNKNDMNRKNKPIHSVKSQNLYVGNISSKVIADKMKSTFIKEKDSILNNRTFLVRKKLFKSVKSKTNKELSLCEPLDYSDDDSESPETKLSCTFKRPGTVESEKNECPPYKVIEGTTFAVDAFNYGRLKNVTAYFLTHFHTDHYVGLTKKFSMPIFASKITIDLIRGFISVDENLLNILFLNTTVKIEGVQVTPIDANHCPGAIMLLFQLPCGKRILHTGDFRWSQRMELDHYLKQQQIELVYLDTTHISDKHIISSQAKSISKAIEWVREFKERNKNKKILYVVSTDVIGKENFWLSVAQAFDLKVWSDGKRKKALSIIGNEEILRKIVPNANEADLHVVSHVEASYKHLDEYFRKYSDSYDMLLSIKPKGSDTIDPEFQGLVNSVSIRYSEHSTHKELRRFLRFLLPKRVISTVPLGINIFRCPKIPVSWHTKELFVPYRKQTSILNYVNVSLKEI